MTTPSQTISSQQQQNGPIESFFRQVKTYLPKLAQNKITSAIDNRLEKVAETCDKLVIYSSIVMRNQLQKIPSSNKIKTLVINSSEKTIQRIEEFLNSTIKTLGGKIEQDKQISNDIVNRLLTILSKTIQINSLLVKNSTSQILQYTQSPSTLISDSKAWINKLYIQVSAISITIRDLLVNTTNQILNKLGAKFCQTKNKVKVLLTNVTQPEKVINILKQRFVDIKNVTIKKAEQGVQIIMDRQHYTQNLKKLASSLLEVLQQITVKADNVIQTSSSFTKDLYEKIIRNYKVQKILLTKRTYETKTPSA